MQSPPRAQLRAVILALVIGVHGWLALPVPPALHPQMARRPAVAEELDRWQALLANVGIHRTREELVDHAVNVSGGLSAVHRSATRPLTPLLTLTGTKQGWPLFASPETHPWRLEALARVEGEWRLVLRRLDPEHTLLADKVAFRRVRGVYDRPGTHNAYPHFARWLGLQILQALPEAEAAKIRLVRLHTTRPGAPPDETTRRRHTVVVEREP